MRIILEVKSRLAHKKHFIPLIMDSTQMFTDAIQPGFLMGLQQEKLKQQIALQTVDPYKGYHRK